MHRRFFSLLNTDNVAIRPIKMGEELFADYNDFTDLYSSSWDSEVEFLRRQCTGTEVGLVVSTERSSNM